MQAVAVTEYGADPVVIDLPKPKPGRGEILIRIQAAGVNPMDRQISDGGWKAMMPGTFPLVLGSDVAGIVESTGRNTSRFWPGDVVFGQLLIPPLGSRGTYAEYVAVSEGANLARVPERLDPVVAASLPTAGVTALDIVQSLQPLERRTVLIIGAGGGVGSFATQLAARAGAHVDAIAHADAARRLRIYGVAEPFDSAADALADAVRNAHPDGIDALIDLASDADGFAALASLVRPGGTAVTTRYVAHVESLARVGVTGVNFRVSMSPQGLEQLACSIVTGQIVAPPIRRIALHDVPSSHANFDGKTVIVL
jgi:NADPH:quinone reductase-like Zn-dependent oxidoreductase